MLYVTHMRFVSLFAGIGGFDLGFARAGMTCVAQVEIDPDCRRVLAKHWPDVLRFEDVRDVGKHNLPECDVLCGGFPCQDISNAGKRAGIDGERSGLWSEFARIIREVRPRYVVVENVAALLGRGMGRVLGDLATCGYDAEWDCIPACAVGAPHIRNRVFILARRQRGSTERRCGNSLADARCVCELDTGQPALPRSNTAGFGQGGSNVADADRAREPQPKRIKQEERRWALNCGENNRPEGQWFIEPRVGRVAHGVPRRMDRLRGLGNAVVPQVAEWIGRRIMDAR